MHRITPFLWFDGTAEEAMNFYVSVFPNSRVLSVSPMTVSFELEGQRFYGLNGGPTFRFTEAVSFFVDCETQEEVDAYWSKLTAAGGQPGQCGWLKDRFGLSWQIIPKALGRLLGDQDRTKAGRVMQAMLIMGKIDIAGLERAYDQA
jgi:predicted 3-demethylubiquinone-9 3-methyltransferase (glyoxalase superfamily)